MSPADSLGAVKLGTTTQTDVSAVIEKTVGVVYL